MPFLTTVGLALLTAAPIARSTICSAPSNPLTGHGSATVEAAPAVELKLANQPVRFRYPEPITIQAFLYGPHPVAGAAVSARLVSPSGKVARARLGEDILPGSTPPRIGSYAAIFTDLSEDGSYQVTIEANDNNGYAHFAMPFAAELSEAVAAPAPIGARPGSFEVYSAFTFDASGYEGKGGLPPLRTTTLDASVDADGCILLSWQVPPNADADTVYELRHSPFRINSEAKWNAASPVEVSHYTSRPGKAQERRVCGLPSGRHHFALRSVDDRGRRSPISNDYIVVLR